MPPAKQPNPQSPCPCGNPATLDDCCLPYINGETLPPTAEALMRSRYTAHVILAIDYLWKTWSAEERIRSSKGEIEEWARNCEWRGLNILATNAGGAMDSRGTVEFIALFRQNGQTNQHHEKSVFKKTQQGWVYVGHQLE